MEKYNELDPNILNGRTAVQLIALFSVGGVILCALIIKAAFL